MLLFLPSLKIPLLALHSSSTFMIYHLWGILHTHHLQYLPCILSWTHPNQAFAPLPPWPLVTSQMPNPVGKPHSSFHLLKPLFDIDHLLLLEALTSVGFRNTTNCRTPLSTLPPSPSSCTSLCYSVPSLHPWALIFSHLSLGISSNHRFEHHLCWQLSNLNISTPDHSAELQYTYPSAYSLMYNRHLQLNMPPNQSLLWSSWSPVWLTATPSLVSQRLHSLSWVLSFSHIPDTQSINKFVHLPLKYLQNLLLLTTSIANILIQATIILFTLC